MKFRISGLGEVGVAGAKSGCGCPVRMVFAGGSPSVGLKLSGQVTNVTAVRMFVAAVSNLAIDGDPVVLEPNTTYGAVVQFPWVLWLIPGNLTRISARQVQELEAAGYDKKRQERQDAFLRAELYADFSSFKPKQPLIEKVKKHRIAPPAAGRRKLR